jgi:hypothetical protein
MIVIRPPARDTVSPVVWISNACAAGHSDEEHTVGAAARMPRALTVRHRREKLKVTS